MKTLPLISLGAYAKEIGLTRQAVVWQVANGRLMAFSLRGRNYVVQGMPPLKRERRFQKAQV